MGGVDLEDQGPLAGEDRGHLRFLRPQPLPAGEEDDHLRGLPLGMDDRHRTDSGRAPMPDVAEDLRLVMSMNPHLRIFSANGYFDFDVNKDELDSACWKSREDLKPENMPKDGSFFMPRRDSIARRLIEEWLGHEAGPSISG